MSTKGPIKNILLAISGGIAAYKTPELVRLLKKSGFNVQVVLTKAAKELVSPLALQTVSENPVYDEIFSLEQEQSMGHIELANWADLMLVAPITANRMAELSLGFASDLLSTLALVYRGPIFLAPAMNTHMWNHPATGEHRQRLQARGVTFIGPEEGELACKVQGTGRMSEPSDIALSILNYSEFNFDLANKMRVLITAGPTFEAIDPVRYLANKSSGKMGYELAKAFARQGALVHLISGPSNEVLPADADIKLTKVTTASEMYKVVMANISDNEIFIGAAAVADYRVAKPSEIKMAKEGDELTLSLIKNRDIIGTVATHTNRPKTVIGFAAQTHNAIALAKEKLEKKNLDLIICNEINDENPGFNVDFNQVALIEENKIEIIPKQSKRLLAAALTTKILNIHKIEKRGKTNETAHTA